MRQKEYKWNTMEAALGFIVSLVGILLIVLDVNSWKTEQNIWISVGSSLLASGIIMVFTAIVLDRERKNELVRWGLSKIYKSRIEMNADCDIDNKNAKRQVDVVAFGLSSLRTEEQMVRDMLNRGVNFRILTMNPDSKFAIQRAREEDEVDEQIHSSIKKLIKWAQDINQKGYKGQIQIKGYNSMTLDFYWRVDDSLYVGPYWLGYKSQYTISYKFINGEGFDLYTEYFDKLWKNEDMINLV